MAFTTDSHPVKGRTNDVWGTRNVGIYRLTPDSAFAAAGESFDPKALGFQGKVQAVLIFPRYVAASAGANFQYDYANKLILAFCGSTVTGGSVDLSTVLLDVIVIGE